MEISTGTEQDEKGIAAHHDGTVMCQSVIVQTSKFQDTVPKYIRTRAYKAVKAILKDEGRVLVCGSPGSGKTAIGNKLMQSYRRKGYQTMLVKNFIGFDFDSVVKRTRKLFLVIDDVFGRFTHCSSDITNCIVTLENIEIHVERFQQSWQSNKDCDLKLLFTSRTDMYRDVEGRLERFRYILFRPSCVINISLDQDMQLTSEERKLILGEYANGLLTDGDIEEISEIYFDTLGFPLICKMYRDKKTTRKGVDFFKTPLEFLTRELSEIFHNDDLKAVFLLLILHNDTFNLSDLRNTDEEMVNCLIKLSQVIPDFQFHAVEMERATKALVGTYLSCEKDNIEFSHPVICDAVSYVLGNIDLNFALKHCSLKFLIERVLLDRNVQTSRVRRHKQHIVIGDNQLDMLLDRLIAEIKFGKVALALSHKNLLEDDVLQRFLEKLKITNDFGVVIKQRDTSQSGMSFLYWAVFNGVFKHGFSSLLEGQQITRDDYIEAYLAACSNNSQAFEDIRKLAKDLDIDISRISYGDIVKDRFSTQPGPNEKSKTEAVIVSKRHDRYRDHLIHLASRNGYKGVVSSLLSMGEDVDSVGGLGMTPLMYACYFDHPELVSMLLEKGADALIKNEDGDNGLHLAARRGLVDIGVILLRKQMDPNCRGRFDRTPLIYAAYDNHLDMVKFLTKNGATLLQDKTTLHDDYCLHEASVNGSKEVVEYLLESCGMDIELIGMKGRTPLLAACRGGKLEIVKFLISRNASVVALDDQKSTCLHLASTSGNAQLVEYLLDIHRYQLQIEARNSYNQTALLNRVFYGCLEVVQCLVERGADVNAQGVRGQTTLLLSCLKGHEDIFRYLIERGADIQRKDNNSANCLHLASMGKNINIVRHLLDLKIFDVNVRTKGDTALDLAKRAGCPDIEQLLISRGARSSDTWRRF